jgi:nucleoside-diphosphate-sugar epimerase
MVRDGGTETTVRIALVGGSGFIGTYLTARLVSAGHDVRIVDKRRSHTYPELTVEADVRDPAALERALHGCDTLYNLAAEHKDNVLPKALYEEVNVGGARNICSMAGDLGINRIIFTSSVAVYGFAPANTDEEGAMNPFNEYGRTKLRAEGYYHEWQASDPRRSLVIVRPTVVFGPRNRGNVYTLLRQMSSGRFVMVGSGHNVKSMAYVENVAAFLEFLLAAPAGARIYNYVDKPDLDMNSLVQLVRQTLGLSPGFSIRLPYTIGYAGGLLFDVVAAVTRRELPISAIRVKKFCATTQFCSVRLVSTGFVPPVLLKDGLARTIAHEFLDSEARINGENTVFDTE